MSDKNFHISIKSDYSDDAVFMGLINKYYSKGELDTATKRMSNIIYPVVEKEVKKYQSELNDRFNRESKNLQLEFNKKINKEYKIIEEEKNKNKKIKKHLFISFLIIFALYLIFFVIVSYKIFI